ncbi:MAG: hypothetical protein K0S32_1288 [Bacteroidetes bacterium]|jgi:hypothetical protein|nr:hypothetical protein [Bacteroidota bacterium]
MKQLLFFGSIVLFISCGNADPYYLDHQTLLKKDDKGRQGIWLAPVSKDTVVFLNDTGHTLGHMTSGEMIRYLRKNGNKNLEVISDSMNIRIR